VLGCSRTLLAHVQLIFVARVVLSLKYRLTLLIDIDCCACVCSCQWAPSSSSLARAAMRMGAPKQAKAKVCPPTACVAQKFVSLVLDDLPHDPHHVLFLSCDLGCDRSSMLCALHTGRVQYVPPAEQERYPALPP
jgi:hypothetical protein